MLTRPLDTSYGSVDVRERIRPGRKQGGRGGRGGHTFIAFHDDPYPRADAFVDEFCKRQFSSV